MSKPVALILLNWNTPQHTINCVSSILAYCDEKYFDIIITDNGSTDGSLELLRNEFPELIYIDNKKNLGFAEGNNKALEYSIQQQYQYSLLLNTDTIVNQDIVLLLLEHLTKHDHVGAVQPAIYWLHNPTKLWNGGSYFNPYIGITYSKNGKSSQKDSSIKNVDWVTGCCFMICNKVLDKTGLFNKKLFLYYEDVELSIRVRHAGYLLHYLPSVKVFHEAGASGRLPTKTNEGILSPIIHYYLCRNKIWFLRKYGNRLCAPIIIVQNTVYFTSLLVYFIIRRRWKKANYLLNGIKDGLIVSERSIWNRENS